MSILAWIILHIIAFALSCVQYGLKDNLKDARQAYGFSFSKLAGQASPGGLLTDQSSLEQLLRSYTVRVMTLSMIYGHIS